MERGKGGQGGGTRGGKSKVSHQPGDLYALGSKTSGAGLLQHDSSIKRVSQLHHPKPIPGGSGSGSDRKREVPGPSVPVSKKPKLGSLGLSSGAEVSAPVPIDIDPAEFAIATINAYEEQQPERWISYIIGAIRMIKSQRWKPDTVICQSLIYLAKLKPTMFGCEPIVQSLLGLLKREQAAVYKNKGNSTAYVMACTLLYAGFKDNKNWPESFAKVYVDDALNERCWVDCVWCKCFVDNIVASFLTVTPPSSLFSNDNNALTGISPSGSPLVGLTEEENDVTDLDISVYPRFHNNYNTVESIVIDAVKEQLNRRAAPEAIGKGLIKLLSNACGFPEVRMLAVNRMEVWLHACKLWRPAHELMAHVGLNITGNSPKDLEVLAQLVKMRLKTKPLVNAYLNILKEMVNASQTTLRCVVMHTIYNELSNVRNPNNMAAIAALIQAKPQAVPQAMAEIYQELLMRPDEYLRPLRTLTREAVRAGRAEGTQALLPLCRTLLAVPNKDVPVECRERMFHSIVDLVALCIMLTASHVKHHPEYKTQIATIQSEAIWWLQETAVPLYRPQPKEYVLSIHKVMFVDFNETYYKVDSWPSESERAAIYRSCCEVPLLQSTLLRILYIGLSKELPLSPGDALELSEQLITRVSCLPTDEIPLPINDIEVADYIFQLCQYHHPENYTLPPGYVAPSLAIISLYWRAWMMMLMIAAHNPQTFYRQAYDKYPTLKALIEMCITNKWSCMDCVTEVEGEKAAVLQFEGHLAAASNSSNKVPINEQTSRLMSTLMIMDPTGVARCPPPSVLELLQTLNKSMRLGYLLCRQPSVLLDIITRQGTQKAMPWLQDLLHNSEHSLSVLPVQCLCEFLVIGGSSGLGGKTQELIGHLRTLVGEATTVREVVGFFLHRLTHSLADVRRQANRGLKVVLNPIPSKESSDIEWLAPVSPQEWLSIIPANRHWLLVRDEVIAALRNACLVETDPSHLTCYIAFLANHVQQNFTSIVQLNEITYELSVLIVERVSILAAIIPQPGAVSNENLENTSEETNPQQTFYYLYSIFHQYFQKVRMDPECQRELWCEGHDQAMIHWPSGEQCIMNVMIIHAIVILLTYGPSKYDKNEELFKWFLSIWFGDNAPKAYYMDQQEVIMFPDWLKLKMLRSNQPALIQAGLKDLEAQQLVLFIQSFGIPVESMTALLTTLDTCPVETLKNLNIDQTYMAQLFGVQWRRGARGGQKFYALHNLQEPTYPDESVSIDDPLPPLPVYQSYTKEQWKNILNKGDKKNSIDLQPGQINLLFGSAFLESNVYEGNVQEAFTSLQKLITAEIKLSKSKPFSPTKCPYTHAIILYFNRILEHPNCYQFVAGFLKNTRHSCPLLRFLLNFLNTPFEEPLVKIASTLAHHYREAKSPLLPLLKSFTNKKNAKDNQGSTLAGLENEKLLNFDPPSDAKTNKDYLVKTLETCPTNKLENIGRHLNEMYDTKTLMSALVELLQKQQISASIKSEPGWDEEQKALAKGGEIAGLIIDWMADLQPEILGDDFDSQMRLMFKAGGAPWQELLVALLAHRASWRTLHQCLTALLSPNSNWEATTVLELICAMTKSPRIWQGRDKTTPKHYTPEDILQLNHEQIRVLITYILKEAKQCENREQCCLRIESRLPLLLESLKDDLTLVDAVQSLEEQLIHPDHVVETFLLLLYMRVPKILNILASRGPPFEDILSPECEETDSVECSSSIVDKISHCMFTALAATPHSKEWNKRIPGLAASCRSLCRQHPRLALRQLGLMGTLLKGRCHLEWGPFRSSGHSAYFLHTLGILETLQPALFASAYKKQLHMTLDSFFALISKHGNIKDLIPLIQRFASLLQGYISHDAAAANEYLREYQSMISSNQLLSHLAMGVTNTSMEESRVEVITESPLMILNNVIASTVDIDTGLATLMRCLDASNPELAVAALEKLPELVVCMQEHASQILCKVFELGVKSKINTEGYIAKCVTTLNAHRGC